jgi:membrane fusion protein, multidrug efflux system
MIQNNPIRTACLVAAVCATLISCKSEKKDAPPAGGAAGRNNGPLTVEAFQVSAKPLSSAIEVPGSLLPFEETEIRSEISGRIVQLNLKEGTTVTKGTLLVKLFDGDLQAQLSKLEVQLKIAEKTAERQRELLKINGISQQEYDLSELQVSNLNADIALVKVNIGKTEIHAPYTGRLGLKNISYGAYISPTNLLTTISQVNQLKLQFTVPEKYGSQVRNGQEVRFQLDGSPATYSATVIATESAIEENTRSLVVRGQVRAGDAYLVPGAFAKVKMVLGRDENALMIPSQAVIPQGRKKQVILYKGGKAQFTDITTGIRDSSNVQVLSGINPGDTVITTGLLFLRPGADVKLSKIQ